MIRNLSVRRIFEIIIPLLTWSIITMPVWLSPFHPAVVAYLIIFFDVYFFYKSVKTMIMATVSYMNIRKSTKINWYGKAKQISGYKRIKHFVIIPNYKEPYAKVKKTLANLSKTNYNIQKIYIVLALEKSEGQTAVKRANSLKKDFKNVFADFITTYHQLLPHEEGGKASNQTIAAKRISEYVRSNKFDTREVVVTSLDADGLLDKEYFGYLTSIYLLDRDRTYHFYTAPVVLYNNYWKLNFFIRIQTTMSSIIRMAFLSEKYNLIQISVYSMSLWLLESVNYWDVDIIPEDWHIFLQAFFKHGAKVLTRPIYLLTTRDGVRGKNLMDSLKNRYEQEKRWAWGVSDLPYAIEQAIYAKHISFFDKFFRIYSIFESHILWPTSFFLLTLGATIPPLINPFFKRTVMGYVLPRIAGSILTLSTGFVLVIAYLDFQAKHKILEKSETKKFPILIFQWMLFPLLSPIISAFLSSIPALESHTRLLLGKRLSYKVTKKI